MQKPQRSAVATEVFDAQAVRAQLGRIVQLPQATAQARFQELLDRVFEAEDFELDDELENELERVKERLGL